MQPRPRMDLLSLLAWWWSVAKMCDDGSRVREGRLRPSTSKAVERNLSDSSPAEPTRVDVCRQKGRQDTRSDILQQRPTINLLASCQIGYRQNILPRTSTYLLRGLKVALFEIPGRFPPWQEGDVKWPFFFLVINSLVSRPIGIGTSCAPYWTFDMQTIWNFRVISDVSIRVPEWRVLVKKKKTGGEKKKPRLWWFISTINTLIQIYLYTCWADAVKPSE